MFCPFCLCTFSPSHFFSGVCCPFIFLLGVNCPFSVRIVLSPIFKVVSCPFCLCIVLSPFLRCVLSIHLFGCDLSFQCTHCPFTFLDVICPFFECIVLSLCGFTFSGCVLSSNATSFPNADCPSLHCHFLHANRPFFVLIVDPNYRLHTYCPSHRNFLVYLEITVHMSNGETIMQRQKQLIADGHNCVCIAVFFMPLLLVRDTIGSCRFPFESHLSACSEAWYPVSLSFSFTQL